MDGSIRDEQRLGHHPHIHHPHVHNNGKTTGFASIPQTELHLGHHHNKGRNTRPPDSAMAMQTDYHIMKVLDAHPNSLPSQQHHNVSFSPQQQHENHQNQQQPHQQQLHHFHDSQSSKNNNGSAVVVISGVNGMTVDDLDAHKTDHHNHHQQQQGHTTKSSVSVGIALETGTLESTTSSANEYISADEKGHDNSNGGRTRTKSQTLSRPTGKSAATSSNKHSSAKSSNKCKNSGNNKETSKIGGAAQYYHTYNPHNPNKTIKQHTPLPNCTENFGGWAYGSICDTTHCSNNFACLGEAAGCSGGPGTSCGLSNGNNESPGTSR